MGIPLNSLPQHLQDQVRAQITTPIVRNKYGVAPKPQRTCGGVTFDSKAEMLRAAQLDAMMMAGQIVGYQRQTTFRLGDGLDPYRVDFLVFDAYGQVHAEDVKGMETKKFRSHRRRWAMYGPCDLHIIKKNATEVVHGANHGTVAGRLYSRRSDRT